MLKKDVVVGLGEIGLPLQKVFSKKFLTIGYDLNLKLMNKKKFDEYKNHQTSFLHVAIPVTNKFIPNIITLYKKKFENICKFALPKAKKQVSAMR